jgi:hypothetical protein
VGHLFPQNAGEIVRDDLDLLEASRQLVATIGYRIDRTNEVRQEFSVAGNAYGGRSGPLAESSKIQ